MDAIRSLSLKIFPGRNRSTYAVVWRTQRGNETTDRRLYWGDVPISLADLAGYSPAQLLQAVATEVSRVHRGEDMPEGLPEPLGAVGGGPGLDQRLPGVDPDD